MIVSDVLPCHLKPVTKEENNECLRNNAVIQKKDKEREKEEEIYITKLYLFYFCKDI